MPERNCYPIPDTMTFDEAAIVEPLSIGIYALSLSVPLPGAKIGVLGQGPSASASSSRPERRARAGSI